jgi:hypothetical protein
VATLSVSADAEGAGDSGKGRCDGLRRARAGYRNILDVVLEIDLSLSLPKIKNYDEIPVRLPADPNSIYLAIPL